MNFDPKAEGLEFLPIAYSSHRLDDYTTQILKGEIIIGLVIRISNSECKPCYEVKVRGFSEELTILWLPLRHSVTGNAIEFFNLRDASNNLVVMYETMYEKGEIGLRKRSTESSKFSVCRGKRVVGHLWHDDRTGPWRVDILIFNSKFINTYVYVKDRKFGTLAKALNFLSNKYISLYG
jgi:hypothetical protein